MKRIKVGIDVRDLRIAKTGARTYLEEISKEFKKGKDGFEFYFFDTFLPVYTGKNKFLKLIEQARFTFYKQVALPIMAGLRGCDIVFCTDFFVPWLKLGYQTIPVFHDAFFWEYPTHYNKYWLWLFNNLCVPAAKKAAFIVTPTQYAKKMLLQYLKVPESKIAAIYEAPKTFIAIDRSEQLLMVPTGKYLLHVGVFEKRKNLIVLIEAFAKLHLNFPDLKLVLGGHFSPKNDMDDSTLVLKAIQKHQLEQDVLLPGYLPDHLLSAYYKNAYAYIFPSVNEGFGLPVLEAFQHRIPVLIANNTCLPEVGGNATISFDPYSSEDLYQKITLLLENPELRNQLILKGTQRLQHFSWARTADELLELFKKALI